MTRKRCPKCGGRLDDGERGSDGKVICLPCYEDEEHAVGDYDERDPMLDAFDVFHD